MLHVLKYNGIVIAKNVEYARTVLNQMLGLMFRKHIPQDFAMIFVMKRLSSVNVHMLFMRFPIDVIFLNEEKEISGLSGLNPWTGYKAMDNIKYVVEIEAGTIERHGLCAGGRMEFSDI